MKLTTLIVDDESAGRETLADMLQQYCPEIDVAGTASSVATALKQVERVQPHVVFLDIEMPRENGFDFLHSLPHRSFFTVFTTAYSHYALQAIRASAIDYLLKPIEITDLKSAVARLVSLYNSSRSHHIGYQRGLDMLAGNLEAGATITRLNLPHAKGFKVVDIQDITYLSADSNYTVVHLSGRQNVVVSIPLKEFEHILAGQPFFRTHKSHIINLDYVAEYTTDDGGYVILKDNSRVEISKRRLAEFLQYMDVRNKRVHK